MQKQVDKTHYSFSSYMNKARWISIWHQIDEITKLQPSNILEVGPGRGVFKHAASAFGLNVKTLDLDPELAPDYVGTADAIPLSDGSFDVTCAFQVLEHMPFDISLKSLAELWRVAKKAVVISLPDARTSWASTLVIPKIGTFHLVLPRPGYKPPPHEFDGQHYWEIGKQGYSLDNIISEMRKVAPGANLRTYRVHENQYHRFFIIEKPSQS